MPVFVKSVLSGVNEWPLRRFPEPFFCALRLVFPMAAGRNLRAGPGRPLQGQSGMAESGQACQPVA